MTEHGELRATSDKMLEMIERLSEVERTKRTIEVGTPRFVTLAEEAERVARLIFRWSQLELQLARDSKAGPPPSPALTDVDSRPLDRILADWREAQLRLEAARPGSTDAEEAASAVERLRDEYRAAQGTRR